MSSRRPFRPASVHAALPFDVAEGTPSLVEGERLRYVSFLHPFSLPSGDCHMRKQILAALFAAAGLAGVAATTGESLSAQPAAAARTAPAATRPGHLVDGHPDLQGTYDVATMTPLERPAGLGNR